MADSDGTTSTMAKTNGTLTITTIATELEYDAGRRDFTEVLSEKLCRRVFSYLDLGSGVRAERVCKRWQALIRRTFESDTRPIWFYLVFRRGLQSGHDRISVQTSREGPLFWDRYVVYVYACACHFDQRHEQNVKTLVERMANRVQRMCIVDSPVNLPFMMNTFYQFLVDRLVNLQFLYLRELDLENVTAVTVEKMADHPRLKKVVAHDCINADILTDYNRLKHAMVFNGPIQGLRAFLDGLQLLEHDALNDING